MEDQGKRLLLTVGIVAVMYLVWSTFFAPTPPQQQPQAPPPTSVAQQPAQPAAPSAQAPTPAPTPEAAPAAVCDPSKEEDPARWETADYVATFSRCGGALARFELKGAQYRVDGKQIDLV